MVRKPCRHKVVSVTYAQVSMTSKTQRDEAGAMVEGQEEEEEEEEEEGEVAAEESGKERAVSGGPSRWSCPHLPPSHTQARAGTAEAAVASDMAPMHG